MILAKIAQISAIFQIYWRKFKFIGENEPPIGEISNISANAHTKCLPEHLQTQPNSTLKPLPPSAATTQPQAQTTSTNLIASTTPEAPTQPQTQTTQTPRHPQTLKKRTGGSPPVLSNFSYRFFISSAINLFTSCGLACPFVAFII